MNGQIIPLDGRYLHYVSNVERVDPLGLIQESEYVAHVEVLD